MNSLNPETGEKYWGEKYPRDVRAARPAAPIATPRLAGDVLFVSSLLSRSVRPEARCQGAEGERLLARQDRRLRARSTVCAALMSTPVIKDGHIYGICRSGELRCCKLDTGEQLWESLEHQGGKKAQFGSSVYRPAQGSILPVHGRRRADHRGPFAQGLQGDQPGEDHRADATEFRSRRRLESSGVREQMHLRPQRPGNCLRFAWRVDFTSTDAVTCCVRGAGAG